jgi:hypothetical protein
MPVLSIGTFAGLAGYRNRQNKAQFRFATRLRIWQVTTIVKLGRIPTVMELQAMDDKAYAIIHVPSYDVIADELDYATALGYTLDYNKDPGPDVAVLLKAKHLRRWLKALKEGDPRLPRRHAAATATDGHLRPNLSAL